MGEGQADHLAARIGPINQPYGMEPPLIPGVAALARLDGGGLSEVYRGRCTRTGRGVAVKILPTAFDRDTRAQFDVDRTRLGRLRHIPAILQVDDVEELPDGRPYLVTELCTDSLADLIGRGQRLSAATIAAHGHQLATAMSMAHGVGIVHGGVSPRNVLFRRSGEPVLSDFGLTLRRHYPGDPADSAEFAAPETLRDGTVTGLSDLYCLGATLYAALTGRPPFPARVGEHPSERILRVLSQPPPKVSLDVAPASLAELLAELLATEPHARPADAGGVAWRFAQLAETTAEVPMPEPVVAPGSRASSWAPSAGAPAVGAPVLASPADPDAAAEADMPWANDSTNWSGLLDDTLYEPDLDGDPADPALPRTELDPDPEPMPGVLAGRAGRRTASRHRMTGLLAVVVAGLVLLLVLPRLSQGMAPKPNRTGMGQTTSVRGGAPGGPAVVPAQVQLSAVRDHGQTVDLAWHGAPTLEYAIVVAGSGLPTRAVLAHHALSMQLQVYPDRPYCFLVQATDGKQVLQSEPQAIRGANCQI